MQFFKFRNSPNFRAKPRTPEVLESDYLLSSRRPRPPLLAAAAALRTRPGASKFPEPFPTLSGYQAWVLIQPGQRANAGGPGKPNLPLAWEASGNSRLQRGGCSTPYWQKG